MLLSFASFWIKLFIHDQRNFEMNDTFRRISLLRQTNIKARWNTKKIVTGEKCQPNPGDILQGHNFNQSRKISVPIRRWLEITLYKLTLDEQAINESGREKLFKGIKWHKGQL